MWSSRVQGRNCGDGGPEAPTTRQRWREALLALLLVACGPHGAVLTATGLFDGFELESVDLPSRTHFLFRLHLVRADERATVDLELADTATTSCWRTEGNQQACTLVTEPGPILRADLIQEDGTCALDAWLERLDQAWQVALATHDIDCPEGRLSALVEE